MPDPASVPASAASSAPTVGLATRAHELLLAAGATLAVAESLTGGALASALVDVPGVSATFRGGVVAYATDLKAALLGVDADTLAGVGAVDPQVARQMAEGARARTRSTYGLATTGVAGPEPQDGQPPGVVHLAVVGPRSRRQRSLRLVGGRDAVRAEAVREALLLLVDTLEADGAGKPAD